MTNFLVSSVYIEEMYDETKIAIKKAFSIGKIIFSLGGKKYSVLLEAVSNIKPPTKDDLSSYLLDGKSLEDALIMEIRDRYKRAAIAAGFSEKHGIAMLEYAALLEELKDE